MQPGQPKSNAGLIAGVLGGLAAVGAVAAVGLAGNKRPAPRLNGPRRLGALPPKKPCGCGR